MTRVLFLAERVVLSGDALAPNGSAAHAAATLAALRSGFDVLAVAAEPGEQAPARMRSARRLVPARVRGMRQDALALRADDRFAARAEQLAAEFAPDVVYERAEYLVRAGGRLSARFGVPLVLEVNGLLGAEVRTMYRSLLEPLGSRLERRVLDSAAAVVVESPGMAEALAARGVPDGRMTIVPNAVPLAAVREAPRIARPDRAVVTWMGHLMAWHLDALGFLLSTAGRIVAAEPGVRFAIFGGGPGMDALAARAAALAPAVAFELHGVVPRAELPRRLEDTDIALVPDMPPHKLPVKIVEFGAAGLPLVAPRSPSLDAQLEPGVEYQPFDRGDPASLTDALLALVRDVDLRTRLAAGLHAAVRERFTWEAIAPSLRAVVSGVVDRR